ncbi:MAG: class I SAM-dependent methyltransferase [Patescibacteria group bacterium]
MKNTILITKPSADYELVDSGEGEKLERYGPVLLARPDPQALWRKKLTKSEWEKADGRYERKGKGGEWHTKADFPKEWQIELADLRFFIRPTTFKHTGLFPEQVANWKWSADAIRGANREIKVLNLFAYTGGATLAAAKAGASVTHVDASKTAIEWARANAELSGLQDMPIRWMTEDVLVFLGREVKRGNFYDAIIMDPPAFGHGPKDELWKIEEDFLTLMKLCSEVLSENPLFILVSGYASGYSPIAFANNFESIRTRFGGTIESGELTIEESKGERLLPAGIFARWHA